MAQERVTWQYSPDAPQPIPIMILDIDACGLTNKDLRDDLLSEEIVKIAKNRCAAIVVVTHRSVVTMRDPTYKDGVSFYQYAYQIADDNGKNGLNILTSQFVKNLEIATGKPVIATSTLDDLCPYIRDKKLPEADQCGLGYKYFLKPFDEAVLASNERMPQLEFVLPEFEFKQKTITSAEVDEYSINKNAQYILAAHAAEKWVRERYGAAKLDLLIFDDVVGLLDAIQDLDKTRLPAAVTQIKTYHHRPCKEKIADISKPYSVISLDGEVVNIWLPGVERNPSNYLSSTASMRDLLQISSEALHSPTSAIPAAVKEAPKAAETQKIAEGFQHPDLEALKKGCRIS